MAVNDLVHHGLSYPSSFTHYLPGFHGEDWQFFIPSQRYLHYKSQSRSWTNNDECYWRYVTPDEKAVQDITRTLARGVVGSSWRKKKRDVANVILEFVHRLPYQDRNPSYVKYPIETLCEYGGNCVDNSVLAASMLTYAQIPSCFLVYKRHAAIGVAVPARGQHVVAEGMKYYAADAVSGSWPRDSIAKVGNKILLGKKGYAMKNLEQIQLPEKIIVL